MSFIFFLKGFLFGLSISAPVGPMGVLCIRRTLTSGRRAGLLTGLGIATADGIYSGMAAFGMAAVSRLLVEKGQYLNFFGALVLLVLGVHIVLSKPAMAGTDSGAPVFKGMQSYFSAVFFALSNPLGILIFSAFFAGTGLAQTNGSLAAAFMLVAGVSLGSLSWWIVLSNTVSFFGGKLPPSALVWANRISGLLIVLFGVGMLLKVIAAR